jgi:hypothetical protein
MPLSGGRRAAKLLTPRLNGAKSLLIDRQEPIPEQLPEAMRKLRVERRAP